MTRLLMTFALAALVAGCSGGDTPTVESDQKKSVKDIAAAAKSMSKEDLMKIAGAYKAKLTELAKAGKAKASELTKTAAEEGEEGATDLQKTLDAGIAKAKAAGKELMGEAKEITDRLEVYFNEMKSREMEYDYSW